ncbi:right-handed parallel beta-helix repeat-containing protein [Lentisphaera marina]|uniref:right-handed parallel beta-helix repeat-containing protein n=1 Tax=Lentisphaera marina TaxID=1111041 RepID=UPI002366B54C|nr:right-handed parallel beta-helix repeat-containing protein [Lentisphaera marina]MDD7986549.1 right-handed parallel beta-helix repeat-containing protein [Lentisphaera marina]
MKPLLNLILIISLCVSCSFHDLGTWDDRIATLAKPGDDLQKILNSGYDLHLQSGQVYHLEEALNFKKDGQRILTPGAKTIADYAILRPANDSVQQLVNGNAYDHILLKNVLLDGYRRFYSGAVKIYKVPQSPLAFFGGNGANYQTVESCLFMDTRTWSTLKIHEGGNNCKIINNIILGAGVGPRGNGREAREKPFAWGDGITCAAKNTLIANNLILDPTDVGAVLFGAAGSIVRDNVIATISRESLGGINLVDPLAYYKMDEEGLRTDYRGSKLINNYVDAWGGRIHMAFPMGAGIWVPSKKDKILHGAEIRDNTVAGGAAAYGFIAHNVENFTIVGNKSTASYSGLADGLGDQLPEKPGAFIFDAETVKDSKLQKEFKPAERHVLHLLRCNHGKTNKIGYRVYRYGDDEVEAVVRTAYEEMLGRKPNLRELTKYVNILQNELLNSDWLRRDLMNTKEFKNQFPGISESRLQNFRWALWLTLIDHAQMNGEKEAMDLYHQLRKDLLNSELRSKMTSSIKEKASEKVH